MANMQSPGVEVKEFDLTGIVPGVATTEAGIGGVFTWGPVEAPELVSSETELVSRFGKPDDSNFETFHCASNFLAYSDALFVSRAIDANTFNAVATNDAVSNTQVKNDDDFSVKKATLDANTIYIARYPGELGNSLKISVCDSASAYTSNLAITTTGISLTVEFERDSFNATLTVEDTVNANAAVATAELEALLEEITIGDYIVAADSNLGSQYLKVASVSSVSTISNDATATVFFSNRMTLAANVTSTSVRRYWEYYGAVDRAPGTSVSVDAKGGAGDEMHVVVVDEDGKFTGTRGQILEVFSAVSRATDATAEQGGSNYYQDVINLSSRFIYAVNDNAGAASGAASTITAIDTTPSNWSLSGGTNSASESAIALADVARAYDQFRNKEKIDISILITGKSAHGAHGEGLANYIIDNIVSVRKDLIVTISPALADVVNNPYQEEEALIEFRSALRKSSYAFLTTAYKYQYDRYNDKHRWIPGCGDDAGLIARTDKDRDAWWSPAGHNRGVYKNLVKLAYSPDQASRDLLYKNDINPVVTLKGSGTILYGDKTLHGSASAFDRINVRRLFIVLQKAISKAANDLLFEFNDEITRARFRNMVQPYLRDVQGRRGITDFKVVCDATNNTGQVIDSNRFIGDIYIKPARSINYITLNFVAVGTDVEFATVVGQF